MGLTPASGLLAATALHLGFQAVVSAVVYPALAEVPPDRWGAAHAAHSRRITVVVAPVYAVVGAACLRVLRADARTPLLLLAAAGSTAAGLSTAVVAAPTHGRLGREGAAPELLRRLRASDAVRLAGAGLAAGAALAAVVRGPGGPGGSGISGGRSGRDAPDAQVARGAHPSATTRAPAAPARPPAGSWSTATGRPPSTAT